MQTETGTSAAIVHSVTQSLMIRPNPVNTAFAWGVNSKKMIEMKNFAQIVMSAANKKVIVDYRESFTKRFCKFKRAQNM